MSGPASPPWGGLLGYLRRGPGGLLCPMLARAATAGGQIYCSARAAYLWHRQMLWTGQGRQLARVAMGGAWAGLWVAVLPHQGQGQLKPAGGSCGWPVQTAGARGQL